MAVKRLGIIMAGVTGRMGTNQHLVRSILAIRDAGGVVLSDGTRVMPDPILIGRNADKVSALDDANAPRIAGESHQGRQARLL
jgi:20S proteasome alpha/beta subunit